MQDTVPNPTDIPAPASYRWTPALEREFLENLVITGSVRTAAAMTCMSTRAAYDLAQRPQGTAFRLGWAAAVLIARGRLADELLDRAIWGIEERSERDSRDAQLAFGKRRRHDTRLGLAMLARLDRMVETRARAGEERFAQIIAGDWADFLSLFDVPAPAADTADTDADTDAAEPDTADRRAALAAWLAARDGVRAPGTPLCDPSIVREVARISAASRAVAEAKTAAPADTETEPDAEAVAEAEAARMSVWFDEDATEWRTDFPPPPDFFGIEEGEFGDGPYCRTLDPAEEAAWCAAREAEIAPLRRAAEAARQAWFAVPAPANDRDGADGDKDSEVAESSAIEHPHASAQAGTPGDERPAIGVMTFGESSS